jgi:hypothetical protein
MVFSTDEPTIATRRPVNMTNPVRSTLNQQKSAVFTLDLCWAGFVHEIALLRMNTNDSMENHR